MGRAGKGHYFYRCRDCHKRQKVTRRALQSHFRVHCYACGGPLEESWSSVDKKAEIHDAHSEYVLQADRKMGK